MLTSIFEQQKVFSNPTKSILIVNQSNIISQSNADFAMEWHFLLKFSRLSKILQASLDSFKMI